MSYGHGTGIEGGPPKGRRQGVEPAHVKLGPTIPQPAGIEYQDAYGAWTTALELDKKDIATPSENRFPDAIVDVEDEYLARCRGWLDEQIAILKRSHQMKEDEWDLYEIAYRAKADSVRNYRPPFEEASEEVIPAIAMSVEPVVARLRTSIFKQKPVFTVTPLVKSRTGDAP